VLRAATELSRDGAHGDAGFGGLAADCAARLRTRLARPQRASGGLVDRTARGRLHMRPVRHPPRVPGRPKRLTFEWLLAQQGRQHVHSRIDAVELPVTHVTRRQGRPYTLVLNKTDALFSREQEARTRDQTDLEWLAAQWNLRA